MSRNRSVSGSPSGQSLQQPRYKAAFKLADKDASGFIDKEEFQNVLTQLGKTPGKKEIERCFARADGDGTGQIDEEEFLGFMLDMENAWVRVQQKTFTRWANTVLSNRMESIENLVEDIKDGLKLAVLIEILAKKPVGKMNKRAKMELQRAENVNKCLTFLQRDGIKLVNIGADDIEKGNLKIVLGLIWMLILKYQIGDSVEEGSPKWELLEWAKRQIAPYKTGVNLKNFKTGWSDAKVFTALTDSLGETMHETMDTREKDWEDVYHNSEEAFKTAESKFEIPQILDAADIVENPDEHSIMTYVSYFRDYADTLKHNASPANCTADGPGITGGDARSGDADFTIYSCNKQGKQKDSGGDHFGVKVKDPTGAVMDIQVTDNGNGTYSGTYPTDYPGNYEVDIQLKNEPIQGSVFLARQVLGNPAQSYAEGEGLTAGKTGHPANFTIFAMAEDGKRIGRGGDVFAVTVTGPNGPVEAVITDAGNGTYPVEYAPTEAGVYDINVTLYDEPIKDAPFQAKVKLAVDASKSWVEGPGVEKAYQDRPNTFAVHAVDEAGEPVVCEDCEVTLKPKDESSGLPEVPVKVTNNGDGTHTCEYSPEVVGDYVLEVKLDGEDVKDTPKDITIKRAPNAENSWVDGPGVQKALQNRNNPFVVHAMGDDKQPVWGDECSVTLKPTDESSGLPEVPVTVVDNGDGTYACDYVPTHTGDYVLAVKLEGEDVKDTPLALTVKRAPDASKSWAEGKGLKKAFDNKPATFKVHARGEDGEPVWGDECTVTVVPEDPSSGLAEVPAEVTDNGDGTYSVVYQPLEAGNFVVNVQLEGDDVKDMPVKVRVREGVSVDKTGRCKFKATIIARNRDGEAHTEGGADWDVSVMGPEETEIPVKATDNGDGSYSAEYKLTADPDADGPQEYVISMCLNEDHIQGSPFRQFM